MLALGIGANTAIFSVVDAVLLRPLPYREADELVMLWHRYPSLGDFKASVSVPGFLDYQERHRSFEALAAIRQRNVNLTGTGNPERISGRGVTHRFFAVLGVEPALGRAFLAEEDRPDGARVVILGHGLWQRRYGADPSILDSVITLDETPHQVIGVMPAGFDFPAGTDLWLPAAFTAAERAPDARGSEFLLVVGRLNPDATLESARADLRRVSRPLQAQFYAFDDDWHVRVTSLHEEMVGSTRPALLVLLGSVGFVLLIACVNVANLLLARATSRQREIGLRTALGAGRTRLLRQLLTESVLLAMLGGGGGLLIAYWSTRLLTRLAPSDIPRIASVSVDGVALLFTLTVSILTGVAFGLVPALYATRTDLQEALRAGDRGTTGGRRRARQTLVVAEVALAVLLLIGTGLLIKSFVKVQQVDPGFRTDGTLTVRIALPPTRYSEPPRRSAFFSQVVDRVAAVPGIAAAGAITSLPLSSAGGNASFAIEHVPVPEGTPAPHGDPRAVTPGYFDAMGIPILRGRGISARDTRDATPIVVIDEEMVRRYFADDNPLGRRIALFFEGSPDAPNWREIVGVARRVKHYGLEGETRMHLYYPHTQNPATSMFLAVRAAGDPMLALPAVGRAVASLDPALPLYDVETMSTRLRESLGARRFSSGLLLVFAGVAIVMAAVGIYGVMAYTVAQRTREIGIRMAMGAERRDVLGQVVGQGLALVGAGVLVGLVSALGLAPLLSTLLFEVSTTDPTIYLTVPLVLALVALVAALGPARRATLVDPLIALRQP